MVDTLEVDYVDEEGIPRRSLIPRGADPTEGIPVSLDLDELYGHMPVSFRRQLYEELRARGYVEPKDFLAPGAFKDIQATLLSIIREDAMSIISEAKRQLEGRSE